MKYLAEIMYFSQRNKLIISLFTLDNVYRKTNI
jgi:hypothetical protein